jgi:hypothetical protein
MHTKIAPRTAMPSATRVVVLAKTRLCPRKGVWSGNGSLVGKWQRVSCSGMGMASSLYVADQIVSNRTRHLFDLPHRNSIGCGALAAAVVCRRSSQTGRPRCPLWVKKQTLSRFYPMSDIPKADMERCVPKPTCGVQAAGCNLTSWNRSRYLR